MALDHCGRQVVRLEHAEVPLALQGPICRFLALDVPNEVLESSTIVLLLRLEVDSLILRYIEPGVVHQFVLVIQKLPALSDLGSTIQVFPVAAHDHQTRTELARQFVLASGIATADVRFRLPKSPC